MHHFIVNDYHFWGVAGLLQSLHWRQVKDAGDSEEPGRPPESL
jgi:hypothetical protein